MKKISSNYEENLAYMNKELRLDKNFDIVYRIIDVGERKALIFCVDGFTKNDMLEKLLEYVCKELPEEFPKDAHEFSKIMIPYTQVNLMDKWDDLITTLLSGMTLLFVDGYEKGFVIDCRTYPARGVSEPDKDKVMRGSRDGFVETLTSNTALIRRRIRDPQFTIELRQAGRRSMTDIAICYINDRVDEKFLQDILKRIENLDVDALTMNQESLAECLFQYKWYNPFPKFKFTERPDTAAACILEGNIVILVDNSPSAMIMPTSIFDIVEEADDYYFPPVTGSYLRLSRFVISIVTLELTPVFLLLTMRPEWVPQWLQFIEVQDPVNIPIIFQLLILEIAIDGLRLAAVNTPNMLTTPLSVMAALVLGEFSVGSGWFNSETMLYMAFVALANYTQSSFELGYALKFMRIIILILTAIFNVWGFVAGQIITVLAIAGNKTVSGTSYVYPLFPLSLDTLKRRFFRVRLPHREKKR